MSDQPQSPSPVQLLVTRGIPAISLILGVTACTDDPVYVPPGDTGGSTDTGPESDTGGQGGGGDVDEDTGQQQGDTGGDGDVEDTGGEGDTGEGDVEDTGGEGDVEDTGDGDVEDGPALTNLERLEAFCLTWSECYPSDIAYVYEYRCLTDYAWYLYDFESRIHHLVDEEACASAFTDLMIGERIDCSEMYMDGSGEWSGLRVIRPVALRDAKNEACKVREETMTLIHDYCVYTAACQDLSDEVEMCKTEVLRMLSQETLTTDQLTCVLSSTTCDNLEDWGSICEIAGS